MSSLKDEELRKLARDLAEATMNALGSALGEALEASMGMEGLKAAKVKVAKYEINPKLHDAIERVYPKGVSGNERGTEFLDSDKLWEPAVLALVGKPFDKRGMATYFVQYLQAMIFVKTLATKEAEIDERLKGQDDLSTLLVKAGLKSSIKEGEYLIAQLFGRLKKIEHQVPQDPSGWREKLSVALWKQIGGATKPDYERVVEVADEFLANSATNNKIDLLVPDWNKF